MPNLSVNLGGIKMQNPVTVASGTFGVGFEYKKFVNLAYLGAIIPKSVSLKPKAGNPPPRLVETPAGLLNSIGLQNEGIEVFLNKWRSFFKQTPTNIIISIFGESIEEYGRLAAILNKEPHIAGIEINISCPNVKAGGMIFGKDPELTYQVVKIVRSNTGLSLLTKLSPNVTDIVAMAKAAQEAGTSALSLINTVSGMAIDIKTKKPRLKNITGGLSGPAIKPIALKMIWEVSQKIDLPILGMGGISSPEDAIEFILAGATAVAIGTFNFVNPRITLEIIEGIEKYLIKNKIEDINKLRGAIVIGDS